MFRFVTLRCSLFSLGVMFFFFINPEKIATFLFLSNKKPYTHMYELSIFAIAIFQNKEQKFVLPCLKDAEKCVESI